jgi:membrane protein required for colicin V production
MNILDIVIAIPLLWGAWKGFNRGIIYEIAFIVGLVLGLYAAFKFSGWAQQALQSVVDNGSAIPHWVAFIIVIAVIILIFLFYAKLLEGILKAGDLNVVNKIAGAIFGLLKFALVVSVVLYGLKSLEPHFNFINSQTKEESKLYEPVLSTATFLNPFLQDIKNEFKENLEGVTKK